MNYQRALAAWGAARLRGACGGVVDVESVNVEMIFEQGFACCGGKDPDCYCSYAESPRAEVLITGEQMFPLSGRPAHGRVSVSIGLDEFDFATVLGEIVAAADGAVTA